MHSSEQDVRTSRARRRALALIAALVVAVVASCTPPPEEPVVLSRLENGGFELGTERPGFWSARPGAGAANSWDREHVHSGGRSVKVHHPQPAESWWQQSAVIAVDPHSVYDLEGWVRTEDVSVQSGGRRAGAGIDVVGPSPAIGYDGLVGDNDWTFQRVRFNTYDADQVLVRAGLGRYGRATGTAWFDDLALRKVEPGADTDWHIQVLIYESTDFTFTGSDGTARHVVAAMSDDERATAAARATTFVEHDIPALTSGMVAPTVTVEHVTRPLTRLSPEYGGFSPAPGDVAEDVDPTADSVIVIWDPRAVDADSGEPVWIGAAAGLSYWRGTGQLYFAMIIEAAAQYPHRNVFKHEWGHSIVFYFDALGVSPRPTVEVHAQPDQYVNCRTGEPYVWVDELEGAPIPNSIYNNLSGFTHDYYSGTVATSDDPATCIGITPEAWSLGGPGLPTALTAPPSGGARRPVP